MIPKSFLSTVTYILQTSGGGPLPEHSFQSVHPPPKNYCACRRFTCASSCSWLENFLPQSGTPQAIE